MVIGATVFGYIVGSVSALASNPNGSQARETVKILAISNYLGEKKVQQKLRQARPGNFLYNLLQYLVTRNVASKCTSQFCCVRSLAFARHVTDVSCTERARG